MFGDVKRYRVSRFITHRQIMVITIQMLNTNHKHSLSTYHVNIKFSNVIKWSNPNHTYTGTAALTRWTTDSITESNVDVADKAPCQFLFSPTPSYNLCNIIRIAMGQVQCRSRDRLYTTFTGLCAHTLVGSALAGVMFTSHSLCARAYCWVSRCDGKLRTIRFRFVASDDDQMCVDCWLMS